MEDYKVTVVAKKDGKVAIDLHALLSKEDQQKFVDELIQLLVKFRQ
jgi:hypothetical protein